MKRPYTWLALAYAAGCSSAVSPVLPTGSTGTDGGYAASPAGVDAGGGRNPYDDADPEAPWALADGGRVDDTVIGDAGQPFADASFTEPPAEPPTEPPAEPPTEPPGVPSELTAILDDIPGFGAGTRGGRDGTLYTVTGLHFSGPGSLRDALESPEPLWIVFAPGVNGVIQMEDGMRVRSFKTVDARGHDITLQPASVWTGGIRVGVANEPGVEHVVLLNLTFDGLWPDYTEDSEGIDGINIRNDSHHIWVHQCTFTNWADGAIDAKADLGFSFAHHVTISNNKFTQTHQPLAVSIDQLTFVRNYCVDVTKRCIQLNSGGRAHMVNNVIENWRAASIVASKDGAQLLADHNLFRPGPDCDAVGMRLRKDTDELGRWQNERNHWRLSWGWVAFKDATSVDASTFAEARAATTPVQCNLFDLECWDALYDEVVAEAGVRAAP